MSSAQYDINRRRKDVRFNCTTKQQKSDTSEKHMNNDLIEEYSQTWEDLAKHDEYKAWDEAHTDLAPFGYEKIDDKYSDDDDIDDTDYPTTWDLQDDTIDKAIVAKPTDLASEIDEIVQNIEDDRVAEAKGWQGSSYDIKNAIKELLTKERKDTTIKDLQEANDRGWKHGIEEGRRLALADAKLWAFHKFGLEANSSEWDMFGGYDE